MRVATGEHVQNRVVFKQLLQLGAIDAVQLDCCRLGGVNEVLAVMLLAAKFGVPVCPHAGGVGLCEYAQHVSMFDYISVGASLDDRVCEFVDHLHEHFVDPVRVAGGRYLAPVAPGYSIEIRPESLAEFAFPDGPGWQQQQEHDSTDELGASVGSQRAMTSLQDFLQTAAAGEDMPGAAALVARGDAVETAAVGELDADSIARVASITKPITAAAVMLLVDEGRVALDDPISRWLPELCSPVVVRTPGSPLDDVVPASRPITVDDLLTFRAGWGFPSDFSLPAVGELFQKVPPFGIKQTPDEWLMTLSQVPMLSQPGELWLYNTCSDIQGVLVARVAGQPLPEFFGERIFDPLGMTDTGFSVPASKLDRLPPRHGIEEMPIDDRQWTEPPVFPSGAGGLVTTLADWHRFGRMLLAGGDGLLSPRVRAPDDDRPSHAGAARRLDPVPRGRRLGLRRLRPRRQPLRLGRRHRNHRPHRPGHRHGRRPPHPGPDDGAELHAVHAPLLGVRLRHPLKKNQSQNSSSAYWSD